MVRIDMSEYMEKYAVSRLIGAPPGYVGYEEGGQLTEAVRRKPYSVVLFDEVEKAHPDVFNILLQVLDDGRITDSQGRTVDFKNTIIILTSNLGSEYLLDGVVVLFDEVEKAHPDVFNILLQVLDDGRITDSQGRTVDFKNTIIILTSNLGSEYLLDGVNADGSIRSDAKQQVQQLLRRSFRPEFLNRLDEIVFYKPLTKENIYHIIDLQIDHLNRRLADQQLHCHLTQQAKELIVEQAYDPNYGARPLRRFIQHTVETRLSKLILAGSVTTGQELTVDAQNGQIVVQ